MATNTTYFDEIRHRPILPCTSLPPSQTRGPACQLMYGRNSKGSACLNQQEGGIRQGTQQQSNVCDCGNLCFEHPPLEDEYVLCYFGEDRSKKQLCVFTRSAYIALQK